MNAIKTLIIFGALFWGVLTVFRDNVEVTSTIHTTPIEVEIEVVEPEIKVNVLSKSVHIPENVEGGFEWVCKSAYSQGTYETFQIETYKEYIHTNQTSSVEAYDKHIENELETNCKTELERMQTSNIQPNLLVGLRRIAYNELTGEGLSEVIECPTIDIHAHNLFCR